MRKNDGSLHKSVEWYIIKIARMDRAYSLLTSFLKEKISWPQLRKKLKKRKSNSVIDY